MANPGPATTISNHPQNVVTNQAIRLLGFAQGVNANAVADTIIPIINATTYSVSNCVVTNASINLTTAHGGLFTQPAGGGTAIVSDAILSANTGPTIVNQMTVASTATSTGQNLFFRIGTAQGAAATCDIYVYGYDFS